MKEAMLSIATPVGNGELKVNVSLRSAGDSVFLSVSIAYSESTPEGSWGATSAIGEGVKSVVDCINLLNFTFTQFMEGVGALSSKLQDMWGKVYPQILEFLRAQQAMFSPLSSPSPTEPYHEVETTSPPSTTSALLHPSLERIYSELRKRGYSDEDIYIILDIGRKALGFEVFPLQEEEFSSLVADLLSPIGDEKAINLLKMFLEANPHLLSQCEVPLSQLTIQNIRSDKALREYYYKKLIKTLRFAVFSFVNDRLGKKTLRETLGREDIAQWKKADYYFLRFHILGKNIYAQEIK